MRVSGGKCATRHVIIGTLLCVSITSLNQDAHFAKNAASDKLRLMDGQSSKKVEEKLWTKITCLTEGVYTIGLRVPRLHSKEVYSTESRKIGIKSHSQILQGHVTPHHNSGKQRSTFGKFAIVRTSRTQSACSQNSRTGRHKKPHNKNDASAEKHGLDETCGQKCHGFVSFCSFGPYSQRMNKKLVKIERYQTLKTIIRRHIGQTIRTRSV